MDNIKELRAVSAFPKSQGIDSKVRGTNIIIDGKAYVHKDMEALPHDLTMEKAKVVEVEDGIAFQGKHAFLSNHHPCTIKCDDNINCSEQMYQYTCAIENEEGGVARKIYNESDRKKS